VIGNGVVEMTISWQQGLRLVHLKNLATGVDWIPQPPVYEWGPGAEGMLPGLVWRRDDIWPDLAPPSREFVLLGVELFILDYDWFKLLVDFASAPDRFPDGVEAVSRKVKAAGMKFGLGMGFGQAHADSSLAEPCREYVLEKLCGVVDRFGVDWLKTDFDLITTSDAPAPAGSI
jgi:hypothetical protein